MNEEQHLLRQVLSFFEVVGLRKIIFLLYCVCLM